MKQRNKEELIQEIERVKVALQKTQSRQLKQQYTKHLYRCLKQLEVNNGRKRIGSI